VPIAVAEVVSQVLGVAARPVVVHVSNDLSTGEWAVAILTAVGGVAAGVGAAVSAIYSWRAARHSEATAQDARDALAASLKPNVVLRFDQDGRAAAARVLVVGPLMQGGLSAAFPARDVRLEFNLRSGKHESVESPALNPNEELKLRIEESSGEWPPPGGDHVTATVTYSDMRGAGTYRLSRSADLHRPADPDAVAAGLVSFPAVTEPTETRVSP
jgi:hypothetical protein